MPSSTLATRPGYRNTRDTRNKLATSTEALAQQFGAECIRLREVGSGCDIAAVYSLDTPLGAVRFALEPDNWGVHVYMHFMGDISPVVADIPWPELNWHSGKCNVALDGEHAARDALSLLERRLEIILDSRNP